MMPNSVYRTKKDHIVEVLRDAILSGELDPGKRLMQDDLARQFEVSATPVREALRELQAEGILAHDPHKGVKVRELNSDEVREIYTIRESLESLAVQLSAPHMTPATMRKLRAIQSRAEAAVKGGNFSKLNRLNRSLHQVIYESCNMPHLTEIIYMLWSRCPWDAYVVLPEIAAIDTKEHGHIIEAIDGGEAELAGQLMREHIEHGAQSLLDHLRQTPR